MDRTLLSRRRACRLAMIALLATCARHATADEPPTWLSPVAAATDGKTIDLACATGNRVVEVDLASGALVKTYPLPGAPTGLAMMTDSARLIATIAGPNGSIQIINRADGAIRTIATTLHTPVSPILSADQKSVIVCGRFSAAVARFDLESGKEVNRLSVAREPISCALASDGVRLLVAHHLPPSEEATKPLVGAHLSLIDLATNTVVRTIPLPAGSSLVREVRFAPGGTVAAVAHNLARYQMPTTQLDRGWMNNAAVTLIDLDAKDQPTLGTVLLDHIDRGLANPWAVAWAAEGTRLLVTSAGTQELSVIDVSALRAKLATTPGTPAALDAISRDLAFLEGTRREVPLNAIGPRCLVVAEDASAAFVAGYFSDTIDRVEGLADTPHVARSIALHEPIAMTPERRGEAAFNDARLSFQNWQSCGSCHSADARVDGLNWDLLNDGLGNPKSAKSLLLSHQTPPAMSLGVRDTAEMAVRAGFRHILLSEPDDADAQAIDAWLKSLQPVPSPFRENGALSASATRGEALFKSDAIGCARCHPPDRLFTDLKAHDVGTAGPYDHDDATSFDTPTLIETWRTGPFLHDGSAASVRDIIRTRNPDDRHGHTKSLSDEQIDDLVAYVLSL